MATEKIVIFNEDERGIARSWSEVGEIVRCKDCKYWQQTTPNSGNCSMGFAQTAYADDFCSFGERREE